jgi:ribosomal protein S19
MKRDMCADVKMEEGYMRMSIEFNNDESRTKISDIITQVEKEMKIFPSVIRRNLDEHCGNFSVEFGIEEMNGRDAGEFCEAVMHKLGIDHCSI